MAQVAVEVARDLFGRFEGLSPLWLGLGEMGEMLSDDFATAGVGKRLVMHSSLARSETAARRLGCNVEPWAEPARPIGAAEIVLPDRPSVVCGKSVAVWSDTGGRRKLKKNNN